MRRAAIFKIITVVALLGALAVPLSSMAVPDPTIAAGCDPIDPKACLFPFPNDLYTRADATTATGLRLNLLASAMPRNAAGKPINPIEYNRNDGFSPGSVLETFVPGIDLEQTGAPSIKDQRTSLSASSPIVVINASTLKPHPVWAELDSQAINDGVRNDGSRTLLIRPAINFDEGTRYVVALRNLKDANGNVIPANPYFAALRDNTPSDDPARDLLRKPNIERVFATLGSAGIARGDLFLAWDFTVASERNLLERVLSIRDQAFASLGDTTMADGIVQGNAPTFRITSVTNNALSDDSKISRSVQGVYTVPNFLSTPGAAPGGGFIYGLDGLPIRNPADAVATFTCSIPRSVLSDGASSSATVNPGRPSLYGHGLLGTQSEVTAGNVKDMGNEHAFVFCATEWAGMSTYDAGNVVHSIADLSNFSTMADRMQQGFINMLFLARLMIHSQGFVSDAAFQGPAGESLINTSEVFYDGNSQGGIMGGSLVAISPDIRRGVLGVTGMNYSTLLDRSVDWATYYTAFAQTYPNRLDQQLCFALMQLLWDRGESDGYAHHMTDDPPANTPAHQVLMHIAVGDHQVANITAIIEARTNGAAIYQPAVDASKLPSGAIPFWGL
ncbi:MAG: alpha/beta hydrolase, partial [Actinobacteria bacterium]|nr:alpha/beta hydrolase [Actinomycetota bacterium]